MSEKYDGLQEIIDEALESMAAEAAGEFDPQACNLAEFCRRTGLTRSKARTIKSHGFKALPHGRLGLKAAKTVLSGHTGFVDDQLRRGVTNSQVVFDRLVGQGYRSGLTTVTRVPSTVASCRKAGMAGVAAGVAAAASPSRVSEVTTFSCVASVV